MVCKYTEFVPILANCQKITSCPSKRHSAKDRRVALLWSQMSALSSGEAGDHSNETGPMPLPLPPQFLTPAEHRGETVILASYPRSGNSLLRGLLEKCTGVVTGSDTLPQRTLSQALQRAGARGEGVIDGRAWVVKRGVRETSLRARPRAPHGAPAGKNSERGKSRRRRGRHVDRPWGRNKFSRGESCAAAPPRAPPAGKNSERGKSRRRRGRHVDRGAGA